ncbi:hypothetical protein CEXT_326121 [Caerostris extrusa]|uniref:Uncharacterized protein n=1 Tax=Caerostris extrusa TaxID=172846 RepID=A0AAV4PE45_CAEEX|nr:hypothetical protein CEXT_326121 [Caerostris extrusa]
MTIINCVCGSRYFSYSPLPSFCFPLLPDRPSRRRSYRLLPTWVHYLVHPLGLWPFRKKSYSAKENWRSSSDPYTSDGLIECISQDGCL